MNEAGPCCSDGALMLWWCMARVYSQGRVQRSCAQLSNRADAGYLDQTLLEQWCVAAALPVMLHSAFMGKYARSIYNRVSVDNNDEHL